MRTHRYISPEANGRAGAGGGSVGTMWAHDVEVLGDIGSGDTRAEFDGRYPAVIGGADVGLSERWDLFANYIGPFGALYAGGKYQFLGDSRLRAKQGNFSLAGTLAPGIANIDVESSSEEFDGWVWIADASLVAGYRLTDNMLLYGGPFYAYHGLNADRGDRPDLTGHANQFGANLALRFEWERFALDLEGVWSEARWDEDRDNIASFGVSFTWFFGRRAAPPE